MLTQLAIEIERKNIVVAKNRCAFRCLKVKRASSQKYFTI